MRMYVFLYSSMHSLPLVLVMPDDRAVQPLP